MRANPGCMLDIEICSSADLALTLGVNKWQQIGILAAISLVPRVLLVRFFLAHRAMMSPFFFPVRLRGLRGRTFIQRGTPSCTPKPPPGYLAWVLHSAPKVGNCFHRRA